MTHSIEAARARIERLEIMVSTLRHDLRGAISSTSLIADALLTNNDPIIRRSGQRIATTVERIMTLLDATLEVVPSRRP
jgi:signal transduction histidine kinase